MVNVATLGVSMYLFLPKFDKKDTSYCVVRIFFVILQRKR